MRKLLAIIGMLALIAFGLTIGASAAGTPTRTEYLDLPAQSDGSSTTEGWTWTVDGRKGTLTLDNLYLQAPSLVNGQVKDMVAFPGGVTDIQIVLQGSNIIQKTDTWQCDIFAAAGKKVTISGDGSLEFRSADKNSTLVNCDTLVMESGTITIAEGSSAGYLFHTQNALTITGGSMTFKSTYGIRSEKGTVSISGGNIDLTMTNPGYGIYAGPTLAADTDDVAFPAITISGGTITTNGSISDAWFKGLSITGGSVRADKEVRGNLFYDGSPEKVVLPENFATGQLSTTNAYALEIPAGRTLEVPAGVCVRTNHLINKGTLDNRGRVTVNNSYEGEGNITGGGLIDFTSSYWQAVSSHAENAVLNRSATGTIDETGYCYVYGNAAWNSGWSYMPRTMYIPKGGKLTVPSGAAATVSGAITIHGKDSLTGVGTVTSTTNKYFIEYSEDSLTPAAEMDLTYDGTNLRNEVEQQAKEKTPDITILGKTFTLGGDNLTIGYPYGSNSACPAGEGGNRYIEYNYDVVAFPYHRISYRHYFSVKKLQITNETTLEKTRNLSTPYTGSPVNFPETFLKVTHNGKQIIINGNFDISYSNNVEVGDNAVITLTGKNNVEGTLALNYTISPKALYTNEIVLSSAEKVYDGTTGIAPEKVLSLANKNIVDKDKGMVGITADVAFDTKDVGDEKNITISNIQLTGEKAGNYEFPSYITLPSSAAGKITPAPLSVTVTGKDKPYDGDTAAQVDVVFSGLQNGETLSAGDYTVSAKFASSNAGTNIPITGNLKLNDTTAANNYTLADGTFQTTANISKAILTLTAPTAASIEYGQTLASAELSGGSAKNGEQTVKGAWSWANPQDRPLENGSYKVKFTPEDGANYAAGETQAAVSVTPAQPKIIISAPSRQQAGHTVAVTVHVENPHDRNLTDGIPVPTVTYKIGDSDFNSLENGALLIPENTADDTVITIKTVTSEVAGKYTAGEKTFDITVVDKAPVTLSGIVLEDKTYDGQPAAYTGTPVAVDEEDGAPVEGLTYTYQWKDSEGNPLTQAPKNAGSYFLTISAESDTHMGEETFPITIAKRQLTWDVSGLTASKPQNSQGEATVYGELRLSGVINDEVALNVSGSLTTEGLAGTKEPGNYDVSVHGTWTFAPASPENYELPGESGLPALSARVTPVQELDAPPESTQEKQLKLEMETGISTVPAALLANPDLNTPTKLETAMKLAVTAVNSAVPAENIAVYEVSLLVSTNGGATWVPASKDNFPAGGLTVLLPYPEGTGQNTHDFVVTHMFTTGDFEKTPGDIERPAVTKTAAGIRFTVTGLSPIAVGWVKKNSGSGGGGWYPSVSYYDVKVEKAEHGTVTASPTSASSGSTVTLTVQPDDGYKLDKITVTDSQNQAVEFTEKNGKYTFKMPSRNVTVKADFVPIQTPTPSPGPTDSPSPTSTGSPTPTPTTSPSQSPEPWKNPFPDVSDTGWYIKAVEFVCKNGLMSGYANGRFGPNDSLTRAQFAQIIYNKEGRPPAEGGKFSDVTNGWYADAVNWAAAEGIVAGVGGGKFAPDRPITRQDLAVMLWRYAGKPEPGKNELDFNDSDRVSGYAWKALCWASENGIVCGRGNGVLDPKGGATRAEAAQMVMKYLGERIDQE